MHYHELMICRKFNEFHHSGHSSMRLYHTSYDAVIPQCLISENF